MTEGRERMEWQHTSALMAMVVTSSGNLKKGSKVTPADFDPFYQQDKRKREEQSPEQTWQIMKKVFVKNNRQQNAFHKSQRSGGESAASPSVKQEQNNEQS